jgi:hypothetical protein
VLKGGEGGRTTVGEGGVHGLLREDSTKRGGGMSLSKAKSIFYYFVFY